KLRWRRRHRDLGADLLGLDAVEFLARIVFVIAVVQIGIDLPSAVTVDRRGVLNGSADRYSRAGPAVSVHLGNGPGDFIAVCRGRELGRRQRDIDLVLNAVGFVEAVFCLGAEGIRAEAIGSLERPCAGTVDVDLEFLIIVRIDHQRAAGFRGARNFLAGSHGAAVFWRCNLGGVEMYLERVTVGGRQRFLDTRRPQILRRAAAQDANGGFVLVHRTAGVAGLNHEVVNAETANRIFTTDLGNP